MAISDTCKFEFKHRADKIQKDQGVSRNQAVIILADELDLQIETARKMDQRARKELGQIVPTAGTLTTTSDSEKLEKLEKTWGGSRTGSGRKAKTEEPDDVILNTMDDSEEVYDSLFSDDPVEELYEEVTGKPEQEQPMEKETSKPQPEEKPSMKKESPARVRAREEKRSHAMQFATIAISQLSRIRKDDINKGNAFDKVNNWMEQNR